MDHFMGGANADFEVLGLGLQMFILTALPVAIGMAVRSYRPEFADAMEGGVSKSRRVFRHYRAGRDSERVGHTDGQHRNPWSSCRWPQHNHANNRLPEREDARSGGGQATTVAIESGIQNASVGITVGGS